MGKEKLVLVELVMFDLVSQLATVQFVAHPDISESRCLKLRTKLGSQLVSATVHCTIFLLLNIYVHDLIL